ncbi:hypothetical protein K466DRAFT_570875, partial [Polyporus arcularius HHB13444]
MRKSVKLGHETCSNVSASLSYQCAAREERTMRRSTGSLTRASADPEQPNFWIPPQSGHLPLSCKASRILPAVTLLSLTARISLLCRSQVAIKTPTPTPTSCDTVTVLSTIWQAPTQASTTTWHLIMKHIMRQQIQLQNYREENKQLKMEIVNLKNDIKDLKVALKSKGKGKGKGRAAANSSDDDAAVSDGEEVVGVLEPLQLGKRYAVLAEAWIKDDIKSMLSESLAKPTMSHDDPARYPAQVPPPKKGINWQEARIGQIADLFHYVPQSWHDRMSNKGIFIRDLTLLKFARGHSAIKSSLVNLAKNNAHLIFGFHHSHFKSRAEADDPQISRFVKWSPTDPKIAKFPPILYPDEQRDDSKVFCSPILLKATHLYQLVKCMLCGPTSLLGTKRGGTPPPYLSKLQIKEVTPGLIALVAVIGIWLCTNQKTFSPCYAEPTDKPYLQAEQGTDFAAMHWNFKRLLVKGAQLPATKAIFDEYRSVLYGGVDPNAQGSGSGSDYGDVDLEYADEEDDVDVILARMTIAGQAQPSETEDVDAVEERSEDEQQEVLPHISQAVRVQGPPPALPATLAALPPQA